MKIRLTIHRDGSVSGHYFDGIARLGRASIKRCTRIIWNDEDQVWVSVTKTDNTELCRSRSREVCAADEVRIVNATISEFPQADVHSKDFEDKLVLTSAHMESTFAK